MPKSKVVTPAPKGSTLHMIDTTRFTAMRRSFYRRGVTGLSLIDMARIAIDEWLKAENGKPKE